MSIKHAGITSLTALSLVMGSSAAFAANDMSKDNSMTADNGATKSMQSHAQNKAQGLYSTSHLMDAAVYASGDSKKSVGEISDVLLGNGMTVKSFVIETQGKMGLGGGKSYVVDPSDLKVETLGSDHASKPNYKISLDMTKSELAKQPVYSDSWWSNAQTQASGAWQDTKQSAKSAWTELKATTSNIVNGGQNKAEQAADSTKDAADNAADSASNTADEATDNN
ncbi:hypothetical protein [uncultured Salinisphaera sp.]|uniref:hypothetical protein n=1 Tax=uncultured Salinisphaera sp. TaxID=359372 RepID=UPI0032B0F293|tara:strand:+ start:1585 stop:2256 length:672 start_codon:yes stop_codon:yes gene_type:complete